MNQRESSTIESPRSVERILERLTDEVGPDGVSRYFRHQTRLSLAEGRLDVTVPTGFVAEFIGSRFGESLKRAAGAEVPGADIQVRFRVDGAAFNAAPAAAQSPPQPGAQHEPAPDRSAAPPRRAGDGLPLRYRLEEFVVGQANRMAFAAAERLSEADCPRSFSPLFVHGACGLGKTHLLQSIAQRFRERVARKRAVYTTAEAFTNEYVSAIRSGRLDAFRNAYRAVSLLCIDDVQFLSNKHSTQGELLHTFDAIDIVGARIVLASDEHPRAVRKLSAALVSRFLAGMVVRLDPPEPALREKIVAQLAHRRGLSLEPAACAMIANRTAGPAGAGSIREIEGALTRVEAIRRLSPGTGSGLLLIRKALGMDDGPAPGSARRPIRAEQIVQEVCRTLQVSPHDMLGKGRHKRIVLARASVAHLCRTLTTMSFPEIARVMGRPNHSTVVTAAKRMEVQLEADEPLDLGADHLPELAGLNLRGLVDQLRNDIQRSGA